MAAVSTTTFDERALGALPEAPDFVSRLRAEALRMFDAMSVPSQETEEWRYTDLSAFELDFEPFADGGGPEDVNRHGILSSAGVAGERYYALGDQADTAAGRAYLLDYYAFTGPFAERIAAGLLTTPQAIVQFVRGYAEAGCDHLVLFPTVARIDQYERLVDVIG